MIATNTPSIAYLPGQKKSKKRTRRNLVSEGYTLRVCGVEVQTPFQFSNLIVEGATYLGDIFVFGSVFIFVPDTRAGDLDLHFYYSISTIVV